MMPTNSQQQYTRIFLSALAILALPSILSMFPFPLAIAQVDVISQRYLTPTPILQHTSTSASQKSKAKRIALERYQFFKRIEARGSFYLDSMPGDHNNTVLFPIGRSDRIYLFSDTGGDGNAIVCFQRTPGKDQLVYQIMLETKDRLAAKGRHAKTAKRLTSLLDYLTEELPYSLGDVPHVQHYALPQSTNQYARIDLASKRDYVQYSYQSIVDDLEVELLSAMHGDDSVANYDLEEDPVTKLKLRPGEFYRKYGFPVPPQELAILGSHRHHQLAPRFSGKKS